MTVYVKQVGIPVKDLDRSIEFYTKKLGWEVVTDAPMGEGMRWVELKIPGHEAQIVLWTGNPQAVGTFSNIMFTSDDVEKTYEQLKARGVEFTKPPKKESWGISAVFKDLDGNTFSLAS